MLQNKTKIALILCMIFLECYCFFFLMGFFADFIVAVRVYQKIGVFKYSMSWDLVIENLKFGLIGFPVGLFSVLFRLYEQKKNR